MGGAELVVHHAAALLSCTRALVIQRAHTYTLAMLTMEATTPMVNARWLMDKAGLRAHPAYIFNGLGLFFAWVVFRLLVFVPFLQHMVSHADDLYQLSRMDQCIIVAVPVLLLTLNTFWFLKIMRGAMKLLLKKSE